jgi:hypothetical protein
MIRRALTTLTVSLAVVTAFAQTVNNACQPSPAKKPSAAITSSKLKPVVHRAKPSAATVLPRKPITAFPPLSKAPFVPKPPALVTPYAAATAPSLSAPPLMAPVMIAPHPRDLSVHPNLEFVPTSNEVVRDMHLRPLFTSTIHVGEVVNSLVVGAPTLFEVEHKDSEPNLIFVKPSTHLPAESNLLIALASGETISIRLISPGDAGSTDPTDFVVDYRGRKSMFESRAVVLGTPGGEMTQPSPQNARAVDPNEPLRSRQDVMSSGRSTAAGIERSTPSAVSGHSGPAANTDSALSHQFEVGNPNWKTVPELAKLIKANAKAPNCIAIAIGEIRQEDDKMVVSFSILNISNHWVSIMPPQIELTNPLLSKKDAKKQGSFAQPVASTDYKLDNPKLKPMDRADGSITFPKPDSKISKESLLLHIATSASIDTPVYYPLPFVAPSSEENIALHGGTDAGTN